MKRLIVSAFSCLVLASCQPPPQVADPASFQTATQDDLYLEGRVHETDEDLVFGFPGTRLDFNPVGDEFSLHVMSEKDGVALDVSRDGKPYRRKVFDAGETTLHFAPLATRTPRGGHTVSIIRVTEGWQGLLTLRKLEAEEGFNPPPVPPERKLLFIGDSITAGGAVLREGPDQTGETILLSNPRLAYPRVLGERLSAQVHHIAYGGRGLVRDWQGLTDTNNAPQYYDRVLPDNPDILWDPADYQPDIISIMLGTNDFNPGIPDRDVWVTAYVDFLTRIRADYPDATIFLVSSPMTGGEKGEAMKAYTKEAADTFSDAKVQFVEIGLYPGDQHDPHPDERQHAQIADELEPYFRAALKQD